MIARAAITCRGTLQSIIKYRYLTPIQKPVTSLALNSIVEASAESMQFCFNEFAFAPEVSVIAGAFAFRVGLEVAGLFFQSLNMKHPNNWANRWIQKIFLVDMRRDIAFYELTPQKQPELANYSKYYKPQQLLTSFLKTYVSLNFLRGAHYLISSPQFSTFSNSSLLPLCSHDPFFILPVVVIGLNYLILSNSKHPFLIHLVRKENKLMCLNIAFMTGLLFVPSPAIYPLSYIGLALAHLSMRGLRYRTAAWKHEIKRLFSSKRP